MKRKIWIMGIWGYPILEAVSGIKSDSLADVEIIGEDFAWKEQLRKIYRFFNRRLGGRVGVWILQRLLETKAFDRAYKLSYCDFSRYDEHVIVIINSALMHYYSSGYLRRMRKKIKNVKFILYIIDPMPKEKGGVWDRIVRMEGEFDTILTAHPYNTKHYGFQYFPYIYTPPKIIPVEQEFRHLYFAATMDDDRNKMIRQFLVKCKEQNLSYEMYFYKGEKYEKIEDPNVHYGAIPYDENVSRAVNCNCILEMVRENAVGFTQRYYEALVFNKKLLTNNPSIKELEYYDERFMQYYDNIDEINWEWVREKSVVDYGYQGDFNPQRWKERLLENVTN